MSPKYPDFSVFKQNFDIGGGPWGGPSTPSGGPGPPGAHVWTPPPPNEKTDAPQAVTNLGAVMTTDADQGNVRAIHRRPVVVMSVLKKGFSHTSLVFQTG